MLPPARTGPLIASIQAIESACALLLLGTGTPEQSWGRLPLQLQPAFDEEESQLEKHSMEKLDIATVDDVSRAFHTTTEDVTIRR